MYQYIHAYIHTHIHTYNHTYIHKYIRTYVHTYISYILCDILIYHTIKQYCTQQGSQLFSGAKNTKRTSFCFHDSLAKLVRHNQVQKCLLKPFQQFLKCFCLTTNNGYRCRFYLILHMLWQEMCLFANQVQYIMNLPLSSFLSHFFLHYRIG